MFPRLP